MLYVFACSARDVFRLMAGKYKKSDLVVSASFFEIYSGKVRDWQQSSVLVSLLFWLCHKSAFSESLLCRFCL